MKYSKSASKTSAPKTGGKYCLVVEDNFFAGDIMSTFLQLQGVGVDVAENGRAAVDMYSSNPARYGVIFMDLQMPGMSGYEATELIRNSGHCGAEMIPIISMSGEPLSDLYKYGFSDSIHKPFKMQELLQFIKDFIAE